MLLNRPQIIRDRLGRRDVGLRTSSSAVIAFLLAGLFAGSAMAGTDFNGNGMSDVWELVHAAQALNPNDDTDGDGKTNLQESIAGTNPFDPQSVLKITRLERSGSNVTVGWPSEIGKRYQPQSRTDPVAGVWLGEGASQAGTGGELTVVVPATGASKLFRVVVSDVDTDGDGVSDWDEEHAGFSPSTRYTSGTSTDDHTAMQNAFSATNVVTVTASVPFASEDGPTPGTFLIQRAGKLDAITVGYSASGSATGGVDYVALPGSVTLPIGVNSAEVNVTPITNALLQPSRLVTLSLNAGAGYTLGSPANASVAIKDSSATSGTGLLANYYDNSSSTYTNASNFSGLKLTRVDPVIDFNWGQGRPYTQVTNDYFSARWDSLLMIATNGDYSFDLQADDGARLYLDSQLIIDNWPAPNTNQVQSLPQTLLAGSNYPLRVEFYETTNNAMVRLRWKQPNAANFTSIATNNILNPNLPGTNRWAASYFNNTNLTGSPILTTNTESAVSYDWITGAPIPTMGVDSFSIRWTGQVQPQYSETYTFVTRTDDGVKLWVNGNLVIDKWVTQGATDWTADVDLVAGVRYDIRMEYFESSSSTFAQLAWLSDSQVKEVIPMARLYPTNTGPAAVTSPVTAVGLVAGPFSYTVTGNGTNLGFTATNLPSGLVFNPVTRVLSGTPNTAGTYQVVLSASNSFSRGYSVLDLTILDTGRYVTREFWTNIFGSAVTNIPTTNSPSGTETLTNLATQVDWGDNYGARIRGYITPPVTGNYCFWIASDAASEFWLSTDDEQINRVRRCSVTNAVPVQTWTVEPNQFSSLVALTAGQKYYFEALHKEDTGLDHCEVGWSKPGESTNAPSEIVPGYSLSPYVAPTIQAGQTTLYVATLTPQGVASSAGSGSAVLQVNADETQATITLNYGNLTSTKTSMHIHDASRGGLILFDLDTAPVVNGIRQWVFGPVGSLTVADILAVIKSGNAYVNVHTVNYPSGEIKGFFKLTAGTQTFTPPPAPAPLPGGTPSTNEAVRFLMQATFGPNTNAITEVQALGYDGWITQQFNTNNTIGMLNWVNNYYTTFPTTATNGYPTFNAWWAHAITAPDQLRMRVAFALSQIMVVSMYGGPLVQEPWGVASYYDMLAANAFGNFRQLLENMTLHPAMGLYLDMLKNEKPDPASGKNPNENFAREILQLFSIGLQKLHPDGSLMLDSSGLPIPTYDQNTVIGFAHVFTGWGYYTTNQNWSATRNVLQPMTLVTNRHDDLSTKLLLNNVVLPVGRGGAPDLAAALDNIFYHPNTGPFTCRRLIQRLVMGNPSPGYLYRVASVFADNGAGVRGDMQAVVRAILMDPEARGTNSVNNVGYGHLREPILRVTHPVRALHGSSVSGYYKMTTTDSNLGQTPLNSPTVFNFYEPDYSFPGEIATAGLYSPEFQITSETTVIQADNFLQTGVYNTSGFKSDVKLDLTTEQNMATNPTALVDYLNSVLCAGNLSASTRQRIIDYVTTLPSSTSTDKLNRAKAAVQLIVTSPEYSVQR
ncbi:MAG: DUF1800 family protein [Verrucomicrobia bacterium]|nr:DUF1800 family protein [Verrucomicrobiota bacterium]